MNYLEPSVFYSSQESDEIIHQVSDNNSQKAADDDFWGFESMFGQYSAGANKRKHAFEDIIIDGGAKEKGYEQKKKTRCAVTHSLNERLRRQQFKAKIEALRELIPNSYKKDKASTIDDAITYIKMLQCQQVQNQPKPMGTCYSNMCHSPPSMGTCFFMCHGQCHSPLTTKLVQIPNYHPTFLHEMGMETGTGMPDMFPSANHPMVTNQLDLSSTCFLGSSTTPGILPEMLDAGQNVGIDNVLEPFHLTNHEINQESLGWGNS